MLQSAVLFGHFGGVGDVYQTMYFQFIFVRTYAERTGACCYQSGKD